MTRTRFGTTSTDAVADWPQLRARMVEHQLRERGIEDERVLAAMLEVPREAFLPEDVREDAYADGALPIGEGQTMSQPWIVAFMSELLALEGDEKVLEVGTGSGYGAAVLSRLCAHVVTVERHAPLAEAAHATLRELGYNNVEVLVRDGTDGVPERAPFDGISVTATAHGRPPAALLAQLVEHAPLVIPIRRPGRENLCLIRDGRQEALVPVRFVPLVGPS
jgi:protein-L-isoaspartate(D-aspartate) O-methyltransferase